MTVATTKDFMTASGRTEPRRFDRKSCSGEKADPVAIARRSQDGGTEMMRFAVGQKWIANDGKLHGEVVEISDEGRSGILVITDDKGNTVDRYSGPAAGFQGPGKWRVVT
jgi:hypothetical protein